MRDYEKSSQSKHRKIVIPRRGEVFTPERHIIRNETIRKDNESGKNELVMQPMDDRFEYIKPIDGDDSDTLFEVFREEVDLLTAENVAQEEVFQERTLGKCVFHKDESITKVTFVIVYEQEDVDRVLSN